MRRGALAIATAAAAALAVAPSAVAATAGASGGLVYSGEDGERNLVTITELGPDVRVTDRGVAQLVPLTGCVRGADAQTVDCPGAATDPYSVGLGDQDDEVAIDLTTGGTVFAGLGADRIVGGDGPERLFGGDGGDTISGRGGDDEMIELDLEANVLDGGAGVDRITGGDGPDRVSGGPGDDRRLFGAAGDDAIDGGEGDDVLDAGPGPTPAAFLTDADRLVGGPGIDRVTYEGRAESVRVSMADGPGDGVFGEGDDVTADVEQLTGTLVNDQLAGGPAGDVIDGSGGGDVIEGGGGEDTLDGGGEDAAADTLRGGDGADALEGRAGGDALEGGAGPDTLRGGSDGDRLEGGADADTLDGGPGDDDLDGGPGADPISGGDGQDTVRYASSDAPVEVTLDGQPNDGRLTPRGGRIRVEERAIPEGDNVDASVERVTGSGAADTVAGDGSPNALAGAAGEDFLDGAAGADQLSGGGRNDSILARDGQTDRVTCGPGFDYVVADRADLVARGAGQCEYVDDGSRPAPAALRDVSVRPRCADAGADADVSPPGTARLVPLEQRALLPLRSEVDSFDCAVRLRVAVGSGRTRTGSLGKRAGAMRVTQRRRAGGRVLTRLTATDCRRSRAAAAPVATGARFKLARYRRRYGRIAFPAEVRIDSAVMRPRGVASFTVDDRCGRGATVTVRSGRLAVLDLGTDRTIVLGPGDSRTTTAP